MTNNWDADKIIKVATGMVILLVFAVNSIGSIFFTIPEANREAAIRASGTVENIILVVATFYFGSSLSASKLRDQISKVMDNTIPLDADTQKTVTTTTKA